MMKVLLALTVSLTFGAAFSVPQENVRKKGRVRTAQSGWSVHRFPSSGFSLELPATPKPSEPPWDENLLQAASDWEAYSIGGRSANIQILAQRFWEEIPLTSTQVADAFIGGFLGAPGAEGARSVTRPARVNGARAVIVTLDMGNAPEAVRTMVLIVLRDKQALTITCTYTLDGAGQGEKIFNRIVRSLTLE